LRFYDTHESARQTSEDGLSGSRCAVAVGSRRAAAPAAAAIAAAAVCIYISHLKYLIWGKYLYIFYKASRATLTCCM